MGEMTCKGPIYAAFRFDPNVPDLLASDAEAWEVRRKVLGPALSNMKMAKEEDITKALMKVSDPSCLTCYTTALLSFTAAIHHIITHSLKRH